MERSGVTGVWCTHYQSRWTGDEVLQTTLTTACLQPTAAAAANRAKLGLSIPHAISRCLTDERAWGIERVGLTGSGARRRRRAGRAEWMERRGADERSSSKRAGEH
ncbi:hypothetical protein PRIPAC_86942 [Pristionchus pacificus]|uniref:Uncharacterized protein n=1 Tax=Pristionchus pacificus TaxID=54126 RepID=A0A2A6BU40_PRIPA|nr:hypothetical protein PRIPAC_86942 [Pristionchus pacificus]|eukprot:PDM69420.1 hypothetical protein PRIPAC_44516 [Pristionchus pacificus]